MGQTTEPANETSQSPTQNILHLNEDAFLVDNVVSVVIGNAYFVNARIFKIHRNNENTITHVNLKLIVEKYNHSSKSKDPKEIHLFNYMKSCETIMEVWANTSQVYKLNSPHEFSLHPVLTIEEKTNEWLKVFSKDKIKAAFSSIDERWANFDTVDPEIYEPVLTKLGINKTKTTIFNYLLRKDNPKNNLRTPNNSPPSTAITGKLRRR